MSFIKSKSKVFIFSSILPAAAFVVSGCSGQTLQNVETQLSVLNTTMGELQGTMAFMGTIQAYQATQIGMERGGQAQVVPIETTPAPLPGVVTVSPSPTAYVTVHGSVLIEDGICCAGGQAGETIEISVAFEAASEAGEVIEMRYVAAYVVADVERMAEEAWVPFQSKLIFSTQLATNWVGWWISVQYRDTQGNVSPIYNDDISLEGH